jgi:hypothetical protein
MSVATSAAPITTTEAAVNDIASVALTPRKS